MSIEVQNRSTGSRIATDITLLLNDPRQLDRSRSLAEAPMQECLPALIWTPRTRSQESAVPWTEACLPSGSSVS